MEFVRVTESAAIASAAWIGRGNQVKADQAATTAMREQLNRIQMDAVIVIGEGELDAAPMLHIGEEVGSGQGPRLDIAVDPLEGTNLTANDQGNSISVIAAAPIGSLLHAPDMYMEKIAVGPKAAGQIDLDAPIIDNLHAVAAATGKDVSQLSVMVQNRDRHQTMIQEIRAAGAKVRLFEDGDVSFAIATAFEHMGVDMFLGIGGAPEGVVSAVALKCLGGEIQGRLVPSNQAEYERCLRMGLSNPSDKLLMHHLVKSDECIFAATGITDSLLLKGVLEEPQRIVTHTVAMYSKQKKIHLIESIYDRDETL